MTCNDCICSDVCYYKSFNDVRTLKKRRNDVEKICKSFVHRDRVKAVEIDQFNEVVHAHWVQSEPGYRLCSRCMADVAIYSGHTNYCPNCGAKMDGERKDNERKAD